MAVSRIMSQSLFSRASLLRPTTVFIRHSSNKAQFVEIDLESSSSTQADSPEEVLTMGFKKLEDAIHNIVVRRAAPAWLPFRPGSSYWVPPRTSLHSGPFPGVMFEAFGKLGSPPSRGGSKMVPIDVTSEDELMSCTSKKGWPSSAFFIEGTSPMPIPVVEVEVKVELDEDDKSGSESEKDE